MKDFLGIAFLVVLVILGVYQKITKNSRNISDNEAVARPADPPVVDGICHGLLCVSVEGEDERDTYAMVMLKDYSKLGQVVNALFEIKTLEEFKAVCESDELSTIGYFLVREDLSKGIELQDEYNLTVQNEQYTCKRIDDDRIDVLPLPENLFLYE